MKVTIVLPTYNRAAMLPTSVASCLTQTHRDLEVVIVDDGSSDSTPEVCRELAAADARVRVIRQANAKLPAALNTGHHAATGDLLTWISDDNRYRDTALEVMAGYLKGHPEVDFVYCAADKVTDTGELVRPLQVGPPSDLRNRNCVGACFLYRRSMWERVGEYDTALFLCEDYDYWLRVQKQGQMALIDGPPQMDFMVHGESLSSTKALEHAEASFQLWAKHGIRHDRHDAAEDYRIASRLARDAGRWGRALHYGWRGLALAPFERAGWLNLAGALARRRTEQARATSRTAGASQQP